MVEKNLVPWETNTKPVGPAAEKKLVPWETPVENADTPAKAGEVIYRQEKVFTGNEYAPGGGTNPKNMELFENTGDPLNILGTDIPGVRVQKTPSATYFVPRPEGQSIPLGSVTPLGPVVEGVDTALDFLGGDELSAERILQGAGLESLKATGNFFLWLAKINQAEDSFAGNTINKLSEDFNKNFPTTPAGNSTEKLAQEIGAFIIGLIGGRGAVKDAPDLPGNVVKFLTNSYKLFKTKDPKDAKARLELLIKVMAQETSGNIGGTITSPEDVGSYSKDLGLPVSEKVGLFVDNMAFSAALATIGKGFGIGAHLLKQATGNTKISNITVARNMLQNIDPSVVGEMPPHELERRIFILSDILQNNKEFKFHFLDNEHVIAVDSSAALLQGAEEYMRRVYADAYTGLPPGMLEAEVKTKASMMLSQMLDMKRAVYSRPHVKAKDAEMISGFGGVMSKLGDDLTQGSPQRIMEPAAVRGLAAGRLGEPLAAKLNTPAPQRLGEIAAQEALDSESKKNALIKLLEEAKRQVFPSDAPYDESLRNVFGVDLYNNYIKSKEAVNQAFNSVPNEPIDAIGLAQAIKAAGDEPGLLATMGIAPTEGKPVRPIADDSIDQQTGTLISPVNELATQLEGLTLNDLVRKVRPLLAAAKDQTISPVGGKINKDITQYQMLIDYIDELADEAGPEFSAAMDIYKLHMNKFENTPALRQFALAADQVQPQTLSDATPLPYAKGGPAMLEQGWQSFIQSKDAMTPDQLKLFLEAARTSSNTNTINQALIGKAINQLARKGGQVTASDLIGAVEPLLKTLEMSGDTQSIAIWRDAVETLRTLESGIIDAKKAADLIDVSYTKQMALARANAAIDFVTKLDIGEGTLFQPVSPGDANRAFKTFFDKGDAVARTRQLISQAKEANDLLAVDGIKSQFTLWLRDKITTSGVIGLPVGEEGAVATRDLSVAQINKILNAKSGDTTLAVLNEVFADSPKTKDTFIELLQVMGGLMDLRSQKANAFGSITAGSTQLHRTISAMITLGFGVLDPTATKLRTVSNLFSGSADQASKEVALDLMERMIADPDFFEKSLKALSDDATGKTFISLFTRTGAALGGILARGVYTSTHPTIEEQTEKAIPME
jgi:hypothetical protein